MTTPARSAVTISVGMTVFQARRVVAAAWLYVVLRLYHCTPSFYKEGPPWADDACTQDDEVLRNTTLHPDQDSRIVLLLGATTTRERRDRIYRAFGLEARWEYSFLHLNWDSPFQWGRDHFLSLDTLDEMQRYAERASEAFKMKFGRPPAPEDRFDGVALAPD